MFSLEGLRSSKTPFFIFSFKEDEGRDRFWRDYHPDFEPPKLALINDLGCLLPLVTSFGYLFRHRQRALTSPGHGYASCLGHFPDTKTAK